MSSNLHENLEIWKAFLKELIENNGFKLGNSQHWHIVEDIK